jgi:hypothetical protein
MPLYRCTMCGCFDNTGLTDFWVRHLRQLPALCSDCSPGLRWHGRWPKTSAVGMLVDGRGFLWRPQELTQIPNLDIVGIVQEDLSFAAIDAFLDSLPDTKLPEEQIEQIMDFVQRQTRQEDPPPCPRP